MMMLCTEDWALRFLFVEVIRANVCFLWSSDNENQLAELMQNFPVGMFYYAARTSLRLPSPMDAVEVVRRAACGLHLPWCRLDNS